MFLFVMWKECEYTFNGETKALAGLTQTLKEQLRTQEPLM